jgi:UDP-galactopyranose mutase
VVHASSLLKYNKISNMLWETDEVDATWIYFPDPDIMFHRQIQIGKFISPQENYAITEVVGEVSAEAMERAGKRLPHLRKALDHHVSNHAYVVYDENSESSKKTVKQYLNAQGIHTLGRFGEWEYYNMDICMESAMRLADSLIDR